MKVDQPKGLTLYLKERFLASDMPGVNEQLLFDEAPQVGIVDAEEQGRAVRNSKK